MIIALVYIFYTIVFVECQNTINVKIDKSQLFVFKFSPAQIFNWNDRENFYVTITTSEGPDVPVWLHTKYVKKYNSLFIFGAPPRDINFDLLELQISVTNLQSFKNVNCNVLLNISDSVAIKHEIHLRINDDIEDMLNEARQKALIQIFENHLWKKSKGQLFITFLVPSEELGFRLPLSPNNTSGVIVHLGSAINFSTQLIELYNETVPLSKHCPSFNFIKQSSVERFFRPKNFIVDWCYFKLVSHNTCIPTSQFVTSKDCYLTNDETKVFLKNDEEFLVRKEQLPEFQFLRVIILLVFIPSILLAFCIVSWLISVMCLTHPKLVNESNEELYSKEENQNKEIYYNF